jgi:V8-like Glu-specific endopeptidase
MPRCQHVAKSILAKMGISAGLALMVVTGAGFDPAPHIYYGRDDRVEVYQLSGENLADADSVVALFPSYQVNDLGDGTAALLTVNYGDSYNLCPSERFREQPSGSFCSGVLVAPDVIATAAHCVTDMNIADIRFVFGYQMRDQDTPELVINKSDIYAGVEVIAWQLDEAGADWALIRLDRPVVNHRIARIREAGTVSDGQALHIIGHPSGLPAKFAGGGTVRDNHNRAFFVENMDAYAGNSGSPVFNSTTHIVEGCMCGGKNASSCGKGGASSPAAVQRQAVVAGIQRAPQSLCGLSPGSTGEPPPGNTHPR